ncbi:MAG: HD domain-containing protein [Methanomicrobiales archaeon]|nr:HD domain-containing protein [Methanomicrobiales archaeon]
MKTIKDPVHGDIEVPSRFIPLLDTPLLQRLRYIRQLGFSYLVYPGAHHTRFEHSLGTMHLAGLMCRQLELPPEEADLLLAAALLHDIGHGPFSHITEPVIEEMMGHGHQEIYGLLTGDEETLAAISDLGVDVAEVSALVRGDHPLSGVLAGDLDVDRMDYLPRDARSTGVPYGTVDSHRLIRSTRVLPEGLVLLESGINAAESLLIARTLMRPAVYFHHVSRIVESMLLLAMQEHLRTLSARHATELLRSDDGGCFRTLLSSECTVSRDLAERIYKRRLYKRAVYMGRDRVHPSEVRELAGFAGEQKVAADIASRCGIPEHEVLVDIPSEPHPISMQVQVKNRHNLLALTTISPLASILNETRLWQWRIGVYCPSEHVPDVLAAAGEVLPIRPPTRQERLPLAWD